MSPVSEFPTVISIEGAYGRVESERPEEHDGALKVLVNFENGERVWVPADQLILQEDGNFQLQMSLSELSIQHTRPTIAARPADLEGLMSAEVSGPTQQMPRPTWAVVDASAEEAAAPGAAPVAEPEAVLDAPYFPPATEAPAAAPAAPDDFDRVQVSRVVDSVREDVGAALMREDVDIQRVPVNEYVDEAPAVRYEGDRIIIPVLEEVLLVEKRLLVKEEVVITKRRSQVAGEQRELRQRTHVVAAPTTGTASEAESDDALFRRHYDSQAYPGARGYAYYEPAYRYGWQLQAAARFQGQTWEQLEPEARSLWERDNPGTWDRVQPAVRYAWSTSRANA